MKAGDSVRVTSDALKEAEALGLDLTPAFLVVKFKAVNRFTVASVAVKDGVEFIKLNCCHNEQDANHQDYVKDQAGQPICRWHPASFFQLIDDTKPEPEQEAPAEELEDTASQAAILDQPIAALDYKKDTGAITLTAAGYDLIKVSGPIGRGIAKALRGLNIL